MKTETAKFSIKSAHGEELPVNLQLVNVETAPFTVYETEQEIPTGQRLTSDQYVAAVDARIKAGARAKATTAALETAAEAFATANPDAKVNPYRKPDPKSYDVQRNNMIKTLMVMRKIDEATATQIFDAMVAASTK